MLARLLYWSCHEYFCAVPSSQCGDGAEVCNGLSTCSSRSGMRTVIGSEPARWHENRAVTQVPLHLGLHGWPLCRGHLAPGILRMP